MEKRKTLKQKSMQVDNLNYLATVTAIYDKVDEPWAMRITVRADYGTRSFCVIRGLTNNGYWTHYCEFDPSTSISITPRVIADLIRQAHTKGWDPIKSKSNFEFELENDALRKE